MSFDFAQPRPARRPGLTPMIDVVFLILVFFMLAARFSVETALPIQLGGGRIEAYSGPPRLVEVGEQTVSLNGLDMRLPALLTEIQRLTDAPDDAVILRAKEDTSLQAVIDVLDTLRDAGFTNLVFLE
ncbi:MAG: biopolymer transporter ExbD [Pseudomonadota bacterium]